MTEEEIKGAIKFGLEAIAEYKATGSEAPAFVYDRIIDLQNQLIEHLESLI